MTVPARLGAFVLLEMLGKGGMGAVYRALDTTLDRQVAIKVMRGALGHNLQFSADLAHEARAAAALNHPNVAHVYTFGEEMGQPYIVMELAAGGRLDKIIKEEGSLDEARALRVASEVAQGLQAAHEAGLIHADIKPANIVFDEKGAAKVVDFGLAQSASHAVEGGESWGTPFYVSPEQVRKQKIDHRTDIYSLGATLFHALTGRPPFKAGSALKTVQARLEKPAPDVRSIRPELGEDTARIVARMLEQTRARRYPTYTSLLADLSATRDVPRAPRPVPAVRRDVPTVSQPRKNLALPVTLIVAFVLVAAAMLIMFGREPAGPRTTAPAAPPLAESTPGLPVRSPHAEGPEKTVPPLFDQAVANLAAGKGFAAAQQLQQLQREAEPGDPLLPWILFLQAFSAWSDSLDIDVRGDLAALSEDRDPTEAELIPQGLVRFMTGVSSEEKLLGQTEGWAPEGRALAELTVAVRRLRQEDPLGREALQHYLDLAPDLDGWAAAFVPTAERWLRDEATCRRARAEASKLGPHPRKNKLEALRADVAPIFHGPLDREIDEARMLAEKAGRERKQQAEVEQKLVVALEVELPALAKGRAFEQAIAAVEEARSTIKTRALLDRLDKAAAPYIRQGEFKTYLIGRVNAYPPMGAVPGLGRSILRADAENVTIAGGGRAAPWATLSTRTWLALFDYYLARTELPPEEQADLLLSCAVFCDGEGVPQGALAYALKAIERRPGLKDESRELLPDLAWPE